VQALEGIKGVILCHFDFDGAIDPALGGVFRERMRKVWGGEGYVGRCGQSSLKRRVAKEALGMFRFRVRELRQHQKHFMIPNIVFLPLRIHLESQKI
jgi:hypothetical protein